MLSFVGVAFTVALAQSASPADPFADEYKVPASSEVGVGEGQYRPMLLGGALLGPTGFVLRGTAEYTTSSYLAVRGSIEVQRSVTDSQLQSARAGATFHFFPYRRVDLGFWFEAGPAWAGGSTWTPLLVGGTSLDIGLSTLFFLHVDAQLGWARSPNYLRPAVLAGVGVAL